jgi:CheY-like chemotaxis protein
MHALIVDDDPLNIDVLVNLLTLEGVTCTAIQNPTQIFEAIQGLNALDVIFLDLEMPALDGYTVLRQLKEDMGLTMPVVAYTVHTSEATHARHLGFDSFLGKPLDAEAFSDQFRRIVNGERVWAYQSR